MASMAFLIPRPCPICQTEMAMTNTGVKCPQCGHQIFNPMAEGTCHCPACARG